MEGVTIPCTCCGAPLPIMLGRRGVKCRYCGTKQPIPEEAEARLRRHFHRIEAILEVAHLERTREKRRAPAYLVVTALIACFATLVGMVARRVDVMLIGGGVYFVLMIAVGIREHLGANLRRAPAPEAGRVTCDNCGAEVPFVVSEESLECPVCDGPIALDPGALAHAVRVAQADLARAAEESGDPYGVTSRD